jgi:hypothetical protein
VTIYRIISTLWQSSRGSQNKFTQASIILSSHHFAASMLRRRLVPVATLLRRPAMISSRLQGMGRISSAEGAENRWISAGI